MGSHIETIRAFLCPAVKRSVHDAGQGLRLITRKNSLSYSAVLYVPQ